MRRRLRELKDKVFAYTPSGGTPEYVETVRGVLPGNRDRAGPRRHHRHHRRQRGAALRLPRLRERGGRGAGGRAVLHELLRLRDDGRRAAGAPRPAAPRTASTFRRGRRGRRRSPGARAWSSCAIPATPRARCTRADELRMVADFCREHGLFLVADEVYREFVYDGREAISALTFAGGEEFVVVVDSQSKRYSACGIRLGCLVSRNRGDHAGRHEDGPGPPLRARPGPGGRGGRPRARARIHGGRGHRIPAPPRRAVRGPVEDPGRLPPQAGGRVLLRGAPARGRRRGVRALAAHRLPSARERR